MWDLGRTIITERQAEPITDIPVTDYLFPRYARYVHYMPDRALDHTKRIDPVPALEALTV